MSTLVRDLIPDKEQADVYNSFLLVCQTGDLKEIERMIESNSLPSLSLQDDAGWTPLHYSASSGSSEAVKFLLQKGALWAMPDHQGHTAGDVAFSMNHREVYRIISNEGFRAEVLRLALEGGDTNESSGLTVEDKSPDDLTASSNMAFLASKLNIFTTPSGQAVCVNSEGHGVMLGWEGDIMKQTAKALCQSSENNPHQLRILNVGFGLGIIDTFFQQYKPKRHVIVEPHPDVLNYMRKEGWESKEGVTIYPGRWQSFLKEIHHNQLNEKFDVIFWDTFSEDYQSLKSFFENVFDLLSGPDAKFSWFHGLGATSRTLYDIYTEITEMDLREAGLRVSWSEVSVDRDEATWDGIKRRYWNVASPYRLPVCSYDI